MDDDKEKRARSAVQICEAAGKLAREWFADRSALAIDRKGRQDWVSDADRGVEDFIRERLAEAWPDDGVVGEERAPTEGRSGFRWVIDPIDGTTNFVNGIPAFTVVLAGVRGVRTEVGVIHEPMTGETFVATAGGGARVNGAPMHAATGVPLAEGTVAVGYSNRVEAMNVVPVVGALVARGAMFHRNASGALSLAYVAAGRLLGYLEEHMNAWDCLAGQLMVAEAGGRVEPQDAAEMIARGGRVVVGAAEVFDELKAIADDCWPGSA